jgi:RNA polymerase sigma-70 factor (ECF subfamily)
VTGTDESTLIARCLQGEAAAWDELFDRHYAATGRFVFQLAPGFSPEDIQEVCQEAFLSVIKHLGGFSGRSQLQTWIFRIAANKARDYRARQLAEKRGGGRTPLSLHPEPGEELSAIDPVSPLPAPDAALLRAEQWQFVGLALEELGGPCREILELRYFADLDYKEISAALDLNEKTVSSRLSKCHDKFEAVLRRLFSREKIGALPSNR